MYVLTPELALMIKRNELSDEELSGTELLDEMTLEAADIDEHMSRWDELGFTVGDEPVDLASETEPVTWSRFAPNDGTPRVEHRLRHQGLRKADDDTRGQPQELRVEVWSLQRRAQRLHILRQRSGDILLAV